MYYLFADCANEAADCLVPHDEFYNVTLNEMFDIKDDYPKWKANLPGSFSFINYPFVLNVNVKCDILHLESMVSMRHELQDAFFRAMFAGITSPYLLLEVRRESLLSDCINQIDCILKQQQQQQSSSAAAAESALRKQLKISFMGEEGVDEGGVAKEFFQLAIRELFDAKYGLFSKTPSGNYYNFSSNHEIVLESSLEEYHFVGILIGLAIYNSIPLDIKFPLAIYKKLSGKRVGFYELHQIDPELTLGLKKMVTSDFTEEEFEEYYDRTFQLELPSSFSNYSSLVDLKPDGKNIKLTKANRMEYADLYANYLLNESIAKQFEAFKKGFEKVIGSTSLHQVQQIRKDGMNLFIYLPLSCFAQKSWKFSFVDQLALIFLRWNLQQPMKMDSKEKHP